MAEIFIDKLPRLINVSNLILGHFIEHLGMCINNGVWTYKKTEQTLMQPPLDRVRTELFEKIPVEYVTSFVWEGGIGKLEDMVLKISKV